MIPVFKPLIDDKEISASTEALEMGWLGMGSYVAEFEQAIKRFVEADDRYVAALSTGHAALHLGLLLAEVSPGDEVITPSFNNIADFQAILATGASPVFCDIDNDSLCIDLDKAEELVGPETRAMIVMDYDCLLCDHQAVQAFAEKHSIRIIHDAAHSLGSRYNNRPVGSFSDICMFSFDPVKTITAIDGGALVVQTEEELQKLHELRLIGMTQPAADMYRNQRAWSYDVQHIGYRYHMANLHAAIGLAQLARIDTITSSRQQACRFYNEQLGDIDEVTVPKTDFKDITPFLYYIRVPADKRDGLRDFLSEQGVDSGIHWQPGHWFSLLKECRRGDLTVTEQVGNEILSLPLHSCMDEADLRIVVDAVRKFFTGGK